MEVDPNIIDCDLFQSFVRNVEDYAVFMVDPQGRVASWNRGAERLLGYAADEIVGRSHSVFFTAEEIQAGIPESEMRNALAGDLVRDRWQVRKDGSQFWSSERLTPKRDEDGAVRGFAAIVRDLTDSGLQEQAAEGTEQRQTEAAVRQSEAREAGILETALDCIIMMDHLGRVVEFNPAAEKTFGYSRAAAIGKELAELVVPPSLRERHRRGLARYLATGEASILNRRIEISAMRADGTEFPTELSITRIHTPGPPLFTAYLRDITERTNLEARRGARLTITQIVANAASAQEAAAGVLREVCDRLGWDVGLFWTLDRKGKRLRCLESWRRPGAAGAEIEAASKHRGFEMGEGLPGHVWASGQSIWIRDLDENENFPRLAHAVKDGLRGAFGCSVVVGGETSGVIELFSRRVQEPDADLLEMVETAAGQIGQLVERGRAEESLRESEERYRSLMEQAPFSVQVFSPDGRTVSVNRAWEELWEATLQDVEDYNILEDQQLQDRGVTPLIQRAFAGEALIIPDSEYDPVAYDPNAPLPDRTQHKDSTRWVSAVAYPIKDDAGQVREIVLIHEDISDRRRAEAAVHESEEKLHLLVDTIPQLAWMANPDGYVFWYNRRWYEYTGAAPEQMEGWGW